MFAAPYGNLFTDIHLGAASAPWGWVERGQVSCLVLEIDGKA
jgi:hypothetical protein